MPLLPLLLLLCSHSLRRCTLENQVRLVTTLLPNCPLPVGAD